MRHLKVEKLEAREMLAVSLPGNLNGDSAVNAADYVLWRKSLGQSVVAHTGADASGNGIVDQTDYNIWRSDFGATTAATSESSNPFAANAVDAADYVLWRKTLGKVVTPYSGEDTSGNGRIDQADYNIWRRDFGIAGSPNWFDANVVDAALRTLGSNLYIDGRIDRADAMALFREVETDGTVTATELSDLQSIVTTPSLFGSLDYVHKLSSYTVNGYAITNQYTGTTTTIAGLSAGASGATLEQRVEKWFLGADHPVAGGDYRPVAGSLFVDGPSYTDIRQGSVNDCYFLASLAETALKDPSAITNMFIVNGDGTYTVRFYNGSTAEYVTVDSYLPTSTSGHLVYADLGALYNDPNNELWTALAEKAYAQVNEMGWIRSGSSGSGENSYLAIVNGYIYLSLGQVTGQSTSSFDYTTLPTSFTNFVNAYNQNELIGFASGATPGSSSVVANHAYAVVDYDATNQTVTLFNPWGIQVGLITMDWTQIQANFLYFDQTV
ncbi:MAG TPA: C2 family cysteine protease [Lacipirellulaceae bacterium]|nr:C2 family cysteine protease [Lacipirellulaceae bacterium]